MVNVITFKHSHLEYITYRYMKPFYECAKMIVLVVVLLVEIIENYTHTKLILESSSWYYKMTSLHKHTYFRCDEETKGYASHHSPFRVHKLVDLWNHLVKTIYFMNEGGLYWPIEKSKDVYVWMHYVYDLLKLFCFNCIVLIKHLNILS